MDNTTNSNSQNQPPQTDATLANTEATPIADALNVEQKKKSSGSKIAILFGGVLIAMYVLLVFLINFTSLKVPALSAIVPNLHKKIVAIDSTNVNTSVPLGDTALAAIDTTTPNIDTTAAEIAEAAASTSASTAAASTIVNEAATPEEKKTAAPKKVVEKKSVAAPTATNNSVAKSSSPTSSSTSNNHVVGTIKSANTDATSNSSTSYSSKKEKTTPNVSANQNYSAKAVHDYAVYNSSNSYTIPAGQISSTANPNYSYKTNPAKLNSSPSAAAHSNSYVSYSTSEATFIKASKPYPTTLDGYFKAISNPEIDYDTRFAFSERCLQTFFTPGAQAQQVDETGKVMNTISMEDLFGVMRVNEFNIALKDKQQSGSRLSSIKFNYKF